MLFFRFQVFPLLVVFFVLLATVICPFKLFARSVDISLFLGIPVPVRVLGYRGDSSGFSYRWLAGFDTSVGIPVKSKLRTYFSFSDSWIKGDSSSGAGSLSYISMSIGLYGRFEEDLIVFQTGVGPTIVQLSLDVGGTDHLELWMYGIQWRSSLMYKFSDRLEAGIGFFAEYISKPWNRSTYFNKPLGTSLLGMLGISVCWNFM
jgi:hypothetical protein